MAEDTNAALARQADVPAGPESDSKGIDLRQEILELIAPYNELDPPPLPFNAAELVVIAIIGLGPASTTKREILRYILRHFRELTMQTIDDVVVSAYDRIGPVLPTDPGEPVLGDFEKTFQSAQVPIHWDMQRPTGTDFSGWSYYDMPWTVDPRAARIFLSKHLQVERQGTFDLFALPAELRTLIYEYVLSYDEVEIRTGGWGDGQMTTLYTTREVLRCELNPDVVESNSARLPDLNDILALTRGNKQAYKEAIPVFFAINTVRCSDVHALKTLTSTLRASDPRETPGRHALCPNEPVRTQCLKKLHICNIDYPFYSDDSINMNDVLEGALAFRNLAHITVTLFESSVDSDLGGDGTDFRGFEMLVNVMHKIGSYTLNNGTAESRQRLLSELAKRRAEAEHGS